MDLLGKAIADYYEKGSSEPLRSKSSLGMVETVPVSYFFRDFGQMPLLEKEALGHCRGAVLDIGCGAGSHSLYLQDRGLMVTGLDQGCMATRVAALRGVRNTVCSDILDFRVGKFDTLLLLMNGIGLAGTLEGLGKLLGHLAGLLNPGGQILLDSSDLIYLFETDHDGGVWVPGDVAYYGEVTYRWMLGKQQGDTFPWLFVDYLTLSREAARAGFESTLLEAGPHYDYLARLLWKGI